jgi:hypothetical protein
MKKNWFFIGAVALLLVAAVLMVNSAKTDPRAPIAIATPAPDAHKHATENTPSEAKPIPAFLTVAPSKGSLAPTLDPEKFTGPTRDAYLAVRAIPTTIAQLPCYCHCDKGFGHKSLYSCFEDDHAAHCAVCVNEALLALRLERDKKMTPAQIRETIIAQYSE